ncbi:hypothetical protein [Yersinia pseudotuberculosis]|uniref:hypothetical protein n=1 Tax=Yersinia pseudotuberculosis TaxID=633 RepID=UPI002B30963C|nr:hypothetical protein YPSE1_45420 [Yersinia pseudotuberculosis]
MYIYSKKPKDTNLVVKGVGCERLTNESESELSPSVMSKITGVVISIINTGFSVAMTLLNVFCWLAVAIPVVAFWVVVFYDDSIAINVDFIKGIFNSLSP